VEEAKKQDNIESITRKALPGVSEQAAPQDMENDWITNFFDKCRLTSDEEMQNLWAKVLGGEASAPGKYSKRTVNLLAGLDKNDAEMFSKLCSFCFIFEDKVHPMIYSMTHNIYNDHGMNFDLLAHLESIGFIHLDDIGYYEAELPRRVITSYFGTIVCIEVDKKESYQIDVGCVLLTKVGEQLVPICGSQPVEGFLDYVIEQWKGFGYKVEQNDDQRRGELT